MGLFDSLFGSKSNTVTQEPLITDQQKQAQNFLAQLFQSGSAGGLNLGQAYNGSLGDFNLTELQKQAGGQFGDLINGQKTQGFDTALANLTKLSDSGTDINSDLFQSFRNQVNRATGDANNVLNREAAITGSRFGTGILDRKQDLAAQQSDILGTKLLDLFNQAQNRSLSASQALGSLGFADQENQRANLSGALQFGELDRGLRNQQAQASLNEFLRQRNEQLSRVDIASNLFNKNVPYGVKSVTTSQPSAFSSLLNGVVGSAGFLNSLGESTAGGLGSLGSSVLGALGIGGSLGAAGAGAGAGLGAGALGAGVGAGIGGIGAATAGAAGATAGGIGSLLAFLPFLSSETLKDDIKTITDGLSVVNKMRPVDYNWKHDGSPDGGLIAEELEAILPDAVTDVNGIKAIKPMKVIGELISAIKQLSTRIETLEAVNG